MNAQETGEVPVFLFTVSHPNLGSPLRFSSDPTQLHTDTPLVYKTVSRGLTFFYMPISAVLPDDKDESPPSAKITLDNVNRETITLLGRPIPRPRS